MLDVAELLQRSQLQAVDLIGDLRASKRELAKREADLEQAERRADELTQRAEAERKRIEDGMAAQQEAIRGYEAEIRQLQAEEARATAPHRRGGAPAPRGGARGRRCRRRGCGRADTADRRRRGWRRRAPVALPAPPPSDGSLGARAVSAAMQWLGTPYSWGGGSASGPTAGIGRGAGTVGFDCSGLTLYAWAQVGVSLSHFTGSQWNEGARISSMSQLLPGDLVFFGGDLGHMGMYIGGGQMIHAPHTGDVVKISDDQLGLLRIGVPRRGAARVGPA